ncbi:MAG: hypothetical protein AB7S50_09430 [Bacteroidales bacterium]
MGKNYLLLIFVLFLAFSKSLSAIEPDKKPEKSFITSESFTADLLLNQNYQQFQLQLINMDENQVLIHQSLIKRKKKNDYLMLYVAGGLLAATGVLILANNPDNYVSNSSSDAYLGIAIGGTVASGMIIAKFFIDRKR